MERKKTTDYSPEVLRLFDRYVHGDLSRRDFLEQAAKYALGSMTAATILESLAPNFAWAQQVAKDDKRIKVDSVKYPSPQGSGQMRGYLAKPSKANEKFPTVIVIHENRGLNPYIEDVARRFAVENFVAFAPNALTPLGGYPGNEDKAKELFATLDPVKRTEDLMAAFDFMKTHPQSSGRIGAIGFCFGGGIAAAMAVRFSDLAGAVSFYGSQPAAEDVVKIKAPLQIHLAEKDERINAGWPAYEKTLRENKTKYEMFMYAKVEHGFHNDTTPRYDEPSAKLAWRRSLEFLNKNLRKS